MQKLKKNIREKKDFQPKQPKSNFREIKQWTPTVYLEDNGKLNQSMAKEATDSSTNT